MAADAAKPGKSAGVRGALAVAAAPHGGSRATAGDKLLYDRIRLGIVSALAVEDDLSFTELREVLATSDGNLSVHARKLEDAGLVRCRKGFAGRVPRSTYRITAKGRRCLDRYLDHMESLIRATRGR